MIEHYVLLAAKPDRAAEVDAALETFLSEIVVLDTVREITAGTNFNKGGLERGWTHGMLVRLDTADDLPGYWEHEAHVRLVEILDDACSDRLALDFETGDKNGG
ncbi:MAG: hypothetical protein GEU79_05275 [Acidimicrobiia bacterium]|nr:hypothetical protein [Acidimicrobiia bacterium]